MYILHVYVYIYLYICVCVRVRLAYALRLVGSAAHGRTGNGHGDDIDFLSDVYERCVFRMVFLLFVFSILVYLASDACPPSDVDCTSIKDLPLLPPFAFSVAPGKIVAAGENSLSRQETSVECRTRDRATIIVINLGSIVERAPMNGIGNVKRSREK